MAPAAELGPLIVATRQFIRRWVGRLPITALILLWVGLSLDEGVRAQTPTGDAAAKARFTFTLARFVQWPPGPSAASVMPLRICVFHDSPAVGDAFALLDGRQVAERPVSVVSNPRDHSACELSFVDGSAAHRSTGVIAAAANAPLLTLGAVDGFLSLGGMVELANVNDALRFDVNLKALRSSQLDLRSQVLQLARRVRN